MPREISQQDKDFIENSPKKIAETYKLDVELHGMRSEEAGIKLQKMIYHYGQTVAKIIMALNKP